MKRLMSHSEGLWRAINLLQHLPGLHIEYPSMDTLDTPTPVTTSNTNQEDAQWLAIKDRRS